MSNGDTAKDVTIAVITRVKCADDCDPSIGITSHYIDIMLDEATKGTIQGLQDGYGTGWPIHVALNDCSGGLAIPLRGGPVVIGGEAMSLYMWDFADLDVKACGLTLHFFDYPVVQIPYAFFDRDSDWT